jgi:hypothetical protein
MNSVSCEYNRVFVLKQLALCLDRLSAEPLIYPTINQG